MTRPTELRALIDRLARLAGAEDWQHALTPTQMAALTWLARANRFSRAPSHLADYLGATRGTVSQTLKTLANRGLVAEARSPSDRRRLSYALTPAGAAALAEAEAADVALTGLGDAERAAAGAALRRLLQALVTARGARSFGLCKSCRYHQAAGPGPAYCALLRLELAEEEAEQICHEHAPRAA